MELNIKDFDDLENYFKRKQQHTDELEHLNTELTIENRKLQRKVDELQRLQVEYINQLLNRKKPSAETDDEIRNMSNTEIIPHIFRKREQ